jgi:hypothetical protein
MDENDIIEEVENNENNENNEDILDKPNVDIKSDYLRIKLEKNNKIIAFGNPIFTKGSLESVAMPQIKQNATKYELKNSDMSSATITFGVNYQNTLKEVSFNSTDGIYINKNNLLACTTNIVVDSDNMLIKSTSEIAYCWLSAYGNIGDIDLSDEETIAMNSGYFLTSTQKPVTDNGNLIFKGPCKVSFQTKNIKMLLKSQQPIQPIQPIQPTQPVQPIQPVQPVQPTQPVQPAQPAQPVKKPWTFMSLFGQKGGGELNDDIESPNMRKILRQI